MGFLFLIRDVLAVLFVALIFASALSPWVGTLERRGVPRPLGILLIYLSIVSLFALTITLLIPPIASEYTQIAARFPEYSDKVIAGINAYYPDLNVIEQFKILPSPSSPFFCKPPGTSWEKYLTSSRGSSPFS